MAGSGVMPLHAVGSGNRSAGAIKRITTYTVDGAHVRAAMAADRSARLQYYQADGNPGKLDHHQALSLSQAELLTSLVSGMEIGSSQRAAIPVRGRVQQFMVTKLSETAIQATIIPDFPVALVVINQHDESLGDKGIDYYTTYAPDGSYAKFHRC